MLACGSFQTLENEKIYSQWPVPQIALCYCEDLEVYSMTRYCPYQLCGLHIQEINIHSCHQGRNTTHTWLIQVIFHMQLINVYVYNLFLICWQHVFHLFVIRFFRIQWIHKKHVRPQGESPDSTRSDIKLDLLRFMRMWTLLHAELKGVATPTISWMLTVSPQATTVCQLLLWMWWEWDL